MEFFCLLNNDTPRLITQKCKCQTCGNDGNGCEQMRTNGGLYCSLCTCRECNKSRGKYCGDQLGLCKMCYATKAKAHCGICFQEKQKDIQNEGFFARDCCKKCKKCRKSWVNVKMKCQRCEIIEWDSNDNLYQFVYKKLLTHLKITAICELIVSWCLPTFTQVLFGAIACAQSIDFNRKHASYQPKLNINIFLYPLLAFTPDALENIIQLQNIVPFVEFSGSEMCLKSQYSLPSLFPDEEKKDDAYNYISRDSVLSTCFDYFSNHVSLWGSVPNDEDLPHWRALFRSDFTWTPVWNKKLS